MKVLTVSRGWEGWGLVTNEQYIILPTHGLLPYCCPCILKLAADCVKNLFKHTPGFKNKDPIIH